MSAAITVLLVGCALGAIAWLLVLFRVERMGRNLPRVNEGLDLPAPEGGWPLVTVVVPAHDEQRVIDACAASLRTQDYPSLEVIFVLDRCRDRTAEILRPHLEADDRLRAIAVEHCPPQWAGKCHAAWTGAGEAGGEFLLFTDADVRFDPRLVRASVAAALGRRADLLSLLPRLTMRHPFERLVQPVASMTLMRMYPIERVSHPVSPRAFANGQFMLFRRECYQAIGGHEAVRSDLLEDLAFARAVSRSGGRLAVLVADDLLEVAMYDTFSAFFRGWTRILMEACGRKPWRLVKNAGRVVAVGILLPVAVLVLLGCGAASLRQGTGLLPVAAVAVALGALAAQAAALVRAYRLMGVPPLAVAAFPLGAAIVAGALVRGAFDLVMRRPVRWGGREYRLEPR